MRIAEAQLVQAIYELSQTKVLGTQELSKAVKSFLRRKRLTKRTGKVLRALEAYEETEAKRITVHASVAHPISLEARKVVEEKATELFGGEGKKTIVTFHEDKSILGGVRLETGNTRYDFSLGRSLDELRKSFSK